jgi:hypothetical protein
MRHLHEPASATIRPQLKIGDPWHSTAAVLPLRVRHQDPVQIAL